MNTNLRCEKCGKKGVHAKGLCRNCYDSGRVRIHLGLWRKLEGKVKEYAEMRRSRSFNEAINELIELGLKYPTLREKYNKLIEV